MNNQDKQTELKRLHDLVFEGAPDWAKWAVVTRLIDSKEKFWVYLSDKPIKGISIWLKKQPVSLGYNEALSKNQPETFLDWAETLIRKGDL